VPNRGLFRGAINRNAKVFRFSRGENLSKIINEEFIVDASKKFPREVRHSQKCSKSESWEKFYFKACL
jgi:hypothetical protein